MKATDLDKQSKLLTVLTDVKTSMNSLLTLEVKKILELENISHQLKDITELVKYDL